MTDSSSDTSDILPTVGSASNPIDADRHADKYDDPRVNITRRGILIAVVVALLGVLGSIGSIYARRTRLEQTTQFWGDETIMALQLAERIHLRTGDFTEENSVELSGMPGLGHLRRALLDERNYLWESVESSSIEKFCSGDETRCVQLELSDPNAKRFEPLGINLDLESGWLGPAGGSQRVQINDRVRTALKHFLDTVATFEQKRYDLR